MIGLAALAAAGLWRLRKSPVDSPAFGVAISLALGTTVALMPTFLFMNYNQMFLIPGCLILAYRSRPSVLRNLALGLAGWGFLSVILMAICDLRWHSPVWVRLPFWNPLLPVLVASALALGVLQSSITLE